MSEFHCQMTGFRCNIKKLLIASVLSFIFIFGMGYLVHHILLASTYETFADLWRNPDQMGTYFPIMMATQFLTALVASFFYAQNHENKGIKEGLRFGVLIGLLLAVLGFQPVVWLPISFGLALSWAVDGLVLGLGIGVINALVYKEKSGE